MMSLPSIPTVDGHRHCHGQLDTEDQHMNKLNTWLSTALKKWMMIPNESWNYQLDQLIFFPGCTFPYISLRFYSFRCGMVWAMFQCCRILNTRHIPYLYIYIASIAQTSRNPRWARSGFFSCGSGIDPRQWNITYLGPFWCSCCWMLLICTLTSLLNRYVMVVVQCIDHLLQSWVKLMMPWMPWTKIRSEIEDEPSKLYSKLDQEAPSSAVWSSQNWMAWVLAKTTDV